MIGGASSGRGAVVCTALALFRLLVHRTMAHGGCGCAADGGMASRVVRPYEAPSRNASPPSTSLTYIMCLCMIPIS
jgi:hypothetical protein